MFSSIKLIVLVLSFIVPLGIGLYTNHPYSILSFMFGVLVGAGEIVARYKDEPFEATFSRFGLYYLAFNGAISLAAYFLLVHYKGSVLPGIEDDRLLVSIVAGFGSMVVMRSKLFSFKTEGGEEYSVGPDAVISTFLISIDRMIDRKRSSERQKLVYEKVIQMNVDQDKLSKASEFLSVCLASYQNLSNAEKQAINDVIEKIRSDAPDLDPKIKLMAMGFGFLNISGESNFTALMEDLKRYIEN